MSNKPKLTEQDREFVRQYFLHDGNGTKAIQAAGFGGRFPQQYASKLLQKPLVKQAIEEERERISDAFRVKAADKKRWLVKIVEKCLGENQVDELGIPLEKEELEEFQPTAAIKAITELNRMEGDHAATKASIGIAAEVAETPKHEGLQSLAERVADLFKVGTEGDT